jgi:NADPH2:quinone reductase
MVPDIAKFERKLIYRKMQDKIRAYQLRKTGKPEILKIHKVSMPAPQQGEIVVRMERVGINYAEILSRQGKYSWAPARPYTPGMEGYGEVVEVGNETTTDLTVGDKVIVGGQYGMYAEYAVVKSHLAFKAIDSFTPEENAAVLVNYMTAWVALVRQARIREGDRVLIQAAAGGVGTAAVQIASKMGCEVFGTASKESKLDLIRKCGAAHAINYGKDNFAEYIQKTSGNVDVVLELVGGEVFKKSVEVLAPFGKIAVAGYASIPLQKWNPISWYKTWKDAPRYATMDMAINSHGISATHIGYLTQKPEIATGEWEQLKTFILRNGIKPVVGKIFDFEQIPNAHRFIESRESVGKIIIKLNA